MKRLLQVVLVVAVVIGLGFLAAPAAHSECGSSWDGTWDGGEGCSGAHTDCTGIIVCPPWK